MLRLLTLFLFSLSAFCSTESHIWKILKHKQSKNPDFLGKPRPCDKAYFPKEMGPYIKEISHWIDIYSKKYNIPAKVMIGIIAQESQFKYKTIGCSAKDYGLTQINIYNIGKKQYKIDDKPLNKTRLVYDINYSIEAGFILFKWHFSYQKKNLSNGLKSYNAGPDRRKWKWRKVINYHNNVMFYSKLGDSK